MLVSPFLAYAVNLDSVAQGVFMSYYLQTPEPPMPSEIPPATPQPETPIEPPEPDLPAIGDPPPGPNETPRSVAH